MVVVLLKAGHNVNACTASGTALHEAALCGKLNVAHALLTRGADPRVRDRAGDTVLDALARFPAHVTHEIVTLINSESQNSHAHLDEIYCLAQRLFLFQSFDCRTASRATKKTSPGYPFSITTA